MDLGAPGMEEEEEEDGENEEEDFDEDEEEDEDEGVHPGKAAGGLRGRLPQVLTSGITPFLSCFCCCFHQ